MNVAELVKKNRSCRRFNHDRSIDGQTLAQLVDLGRLSASAANRQPLKYITSNDPAVNAQIFFCLGWAAYIKGWSGPAEGERPAAYIVLLGDTEISTEFWCDHGIAGQSILLGAREKGLAGCFIGAIDREKLRGVLSIPEQYKIMLVIALGAPAEEIVLESTLQTGGGIKYWRDEAGVHHVPKRPLEEVLLKTFGS